MKSNLHMHSIFSDGDNTPEEIVEMAGIHNIELISLTDHNTFEGYDRFAAACRDYGISYIKGVEIDAVEPSMGYQSEILGYFPNEPDRNVLEMLETKRRERRERVERALIRVNQTFDANVNIDELERLAIEEKGFKGMLSNKLTYRYIKTKGIYLPEYAVLQDEKRWKDIWSMKDIKTEYPLFEVISIIKNSGGYPVLPHYGFHCNLDPIFMKEYEHIYIEKLKKMKEAGLWGVEMHPYNYIPYASGINSIIARWAHKLSLNITYGSDFHGKNSTLNRFNAIDGEFYGFKQ